MTNVHVGFIGLGKMGSGIVANLLKAKIHVTAFDLDEGKVRAVTAKGARPAGSVEELVGQCSIICTSLPHPPVFVAVADNDLLPSIRQGSIVIDFGTTLPSETRRLATAFAEKGVALVDAPVSGGTGGAADGTLRVFAAGDEQAFESVLPLFHVIGDPERVAFCGSSGAGQIVKAMNQIMMGLVNASLLETAALGVQAGVDLDAIDRALGDTSGMRGKLSSILGSIKDGEGESIGVKSIQLEDYAGEFQRTGYRLPLTNAVAAFLKDAERTVMEVNRLSPSFLGEILRQ